MALTGNIKSTLAKASDVFLSAAAYQALADATDAPLHLGITEAGGLGVEIVDVRIKRADLPTQNLAATFQRMQAERERMAADERARGREAAQRVRALADRKAMEIVSEARRDAEIIRGEADAETTRLLAEAFGRDPEFYAFVRSLKAYEGSMTGKNTTIVLNPDSEFFDYIKESGSK